ncbi:regucalcin-like [Diadema antillarum]|uniref:regucalcin-like n=1 Tax=Diadema antillarum TaxID=105358 RepID=UPI003A8705A0
MSVEVVQENVGFLLEGPHWDDVTNTLLYVDIVGNTIYRYDPSSGQSKSVNIGETVGAAVPTASGRTLASGASRVGFVDWESGDFETVASLDLPPFTRFNDSKCDPVGRYWTGTMGYEVTASGAELPAKTKRGCLYRLDGGNKLSTHVQNVTISNGLAWTADHSTMYYIDSFSFAVDAFDYDIKTGDISNRRRVITIPESAGFPDGMCIDSEDMLWVAVFGAGSVNRYNPRTGELLRTVNLPVTIITSCCWGGAGLDELYVTTAKVSLTEEQLKTQDKAGSLFRVTGLGVKGVKGQPYQDA